MNRLETPRADDAFFQAVGAECAELVHRPLFTGDVVRLGGRDVCVILHPCAMRRGSELVEKILVCPVERPAQRPRSDWASRAFTQGFLPGYFEDGSEAMVDFLGVESISSSLLDGAARSAVCDAVGVNLLLQRWISHCSRVIVSTATIHSSIRAQMDEADITMEAVDRLVDGGIGVDDARASVAVALNARGGDGERLSDLLGDPQRTAHVRRQVQAHVRSRLSIGAFAPHRDGSL